MLRGGRVRVGPGALVGVFLACAGGGCAGAGGPGSPLSRGECEDRFQALLKLAAENDRKIADQRWVLDGTRLGVDDARRRRENVEARVKSLPDVEPAAAPEEKKKAAERRSRLEARAGAFRQEEREALEDLARSLSGFAETLRSHSAQLREVLDILGASSGFSTGPPAPAGPCSTWLFENRGRADQVVARSQRIQAEAEEKDREGESARARLRSIEK